jgi:hypothetical protein
MSRRPARFIVRSVGTMFRDVREPHLVIDSHTNETIDAYTSKRAAAMHARELNRPAEVGRCLRCGVLGDIRRSCPVCSDRSWGAR